MDKIDIQVYTSVYVRNEYDKVATDDEERFIKNSIARKLADKIMESIDTDPHLNGLKKERRTGNDFTMNDITYYMMHLNIISDEELKRLHRIE